jgi:phosphomannomutase
MADTLACFKAYDIRGRIPDQLNADIARRIGLAFAEVVKPNKVVVGYDIRLSSRELCAALSDGLLSAGVDVYNIGECGTEEIYFATSHLAMDGGIVVTASHNPMDYNGMKLVRAESRPISGDTGLKDVQRLTEENAFSPAAQRGQSYSVDTRQAYTEHLLTYIDATALKPFKLVVNPGNGGAGAAVDALEPHLPLQFIKQHYEPDGNFPHGVPNPLLVENRRATSDLVVSEGADLGIAWDGDFDRCFFFDAAGEFVEGYYLVGLLAQAFLERNPGEKVVHDPRLTWNTIATVEQYQGKAIQSKTGHAFIKERMRSENAIYGGEMSAHHYFRDFAYCDSGMIPWLLVVELMSRSGKSLAELVAQAQQRFPVSGEINSTVTDPASLLAEIERHYHTDAVLVEHVDGLSMEFTDWRFNVRMSNTEPVVRLNVESRADQDLMEHKRDELLAMIHAAG